MKAFICRFICRLLDHDNISELIYYDKTGYPNGKEFTCRRCGKTERSLFENQRDMCGIKKDYPYDPRP